VRRLPDDRVEVEARAVAHHLEPHREERVDPLVDREAPDIERVARADRDLEVGTIGDAAAACAATCSVFAPAISSSPPLPPQHPCVVRGGYVRLSTAYQSEISDRSAWRQVANPPWLADA